MASELAGWGMVGTPLGFLRLEATRDGLTAVSFSSNAWDAGFPTALIETAQRQIARYFANPRFHFELPLDLHGTPFQKMVWEVLLRIPVGQVRTYGELARILGSSTGDVGGACRGNPCPILVPCHRVVSVRGLGGYTGSTQDSGLAAKRWLLRHEGVALG